MFEWIKKNKFLIILLSALILVGIPLTIHVLFKMTSSASFWAAEWSAGEFLSYYGAILAFIGTVALGALALHQNEVFSKQNDKLMQLQNVPYFSYVNFETDVPSSQIELSEFTSLPAGIYLKRKNTKEIIITPFTVNNMSNYPICSISAKTQGFNLALNKWNSNALDLKVTTKLVIPPGAGQKLYVGFEPFWKTLTIGIFRKKFVVLN